MLLLVVKEDALYVIRHPVNLGRNLKDFAKFAVSKVTRRLIVQKIKEIKKNGDKRKHESVITVIRSDI
jgi:hypothetical protein